MSEEIKLPAESVNATPTKKRSPRAKKSAPSVAEVVPAPVAAVQAVPKDIPVYISPREQWRRDTAAKVAKERAYKSQLVTGKFIFNECPGGELKFPYLEYPGDQKVNYTFKHDGIYTIPLGVAMHLNDNCSYPEYHHNMDQGKSVNAAAIYITTKVHRTSFIPLSFTATPGVGDFSAQTPVRVTAVDPRDNRYQLNMDAMGR
jgi:hypothetical protein